VEPRAHRSVRGIDDGARPGGVTASSQRWCVPRRVYGTCDERTHSARTSLVNPTLP
jgi:hypothetical protein